MTARYVSKWKFDSEQAHASDGVFRVDLRVETAAISKDGTVYTLPRPARHVHVMRHMSETGVSPSHLDELGFVLSDGRFVRRKAALRVARTAGQLLPGATPRLGELTTDDVW